ncbi:MULTISPECIES: AsnC family transcriptional regulator [Kitasatospora]|uniref:DNA-binding Lrp family transcriptional regulator n=2 Tax=Kitasatospora TaxID=2063 RepID=A0ABT1J417_9ACTN|nr:AsnC family transcriptional regulator [Kitasatospora paracochleata]MCP2312157.1 DNA-binding Lrp family transcriptional regulator [Kitasatospora paracochleata]
MGSHSFDLLDRQLVTALQLNARAPFSRIAAVLGVSDQTVARRYARLRGEGSARVLGLSEPLALGEVRWHIRVQCVPDAAGALAEALARREDTTWVGLDSGGTGLSCVARSHPEQPEDSLLLQRLPRTPSVVTVNAHCVIHTFFGGARSMAVKSGSLTAEQVRLLREERPVREPAAPPVLDAGDRRLLEALAADGRAGLAELAAATGWSASTVRRRMDELQDLGVLYFDLDLDWRIFGVTAPTLLWLSVAPAELAATGQALAEHPEIGYAAATTGPTNLHAVLLATDVQAVYTYLTTRIAALPAVRQVETAPIMRTVKGPGPYLRPPTRARRTT